METTALRTQSMITDALTDPDAEAARGQSKLQPSAAAMYPRSGATRPCGAEMRELAAWNVLGRMEGVESPGYLDMDALYGVAGIPTVDMVAGQHAYRAGLWVNA